MFPLIKPEKLFRHTGPAFSGHYNVMATQQASILVSFGASWWENMNLIHTLQNTSASCGARPSGSYSLILMGCQKMTRIVRRLVVVVLLMLCAGSFPYGVPTALGQRTQVNPNFLQYGGEYPFLNSLKEAQDWGYADNNGQPAPSEMDSNGYLLYGADAFTSHKGVNTYFSVPSQFERPGNHVLTWVGAGQLRIQSRYSNETTISCTGSSIQAGLCDNRACSSFTGAISGTTLHVTVAPTGKGCSLVVGQPISGAGITVSPFGTPTIITGQIATTSGDVATYTVNFPQTIGSEIMYPGGREVISAGAEKRIAVLTLSLGIGATGTSDNQKNIARYIAFYHADDEAAYWSGQILGTLFKQIYTTGKFGTFRDLNWSNNNNGNCTTWATRKPAQFWSYNAAEYRSDLYVGTPPTPGTSKVLFTASISDGRGRAGKILNVTAVSAGVITNGLALDGNAGVLANTVIQSQISGAVGGIGTYLLSQSSASNQLVTTESMSVTSNDYVVNLGSSAPVDKQTIIVRWGNTTKLTNTLSIDNGVTKFPLLSVTGGGTFNFSTPKSGYYAALTYDASLKGWLTFGSPHRGYGLYCGVPPEAFIEANAELGTNPWITEYFLAADPITDFTTQYATYIKNNYPNMIPVFETPNELWNNNQGATQYAHSKMQAYAFQDSAWRDETFADDWEGKVASMLCQAVSMVYEGDTSKYKCVAGVFTSNYVNTSLSNPRLLSTSYVKQNPSKILIQSGCAGPSAIQTSCPAPFQQAASYKWVTNIALHSYWSPGEVGPGNTQVGTQQEVRDAYNFFHEDSSQQATIMKSYLNTALNHTIFGTLANYAQEVWPAYYKWATSCAGRGLPCGVKGLLGYEGGYGVTTIAADQTVPVNGSTNGSTCILKTASNGAVAGMTVTIKSAMDGGGSGTNWSTVVGSSYVVQSFGLSGTTMPINLDCSAFNPLGNAVLVYAGSENYVNFLRLMSWTSPQLESLTSKLISDLMIAGHGPLSQYTVGNTTVSSGAGGNAWGVYITDIFGYFPVATSSASSITGSTLTLGGKAIKIASGTYDFENWTRDANVEKSHFAV